MKLKKHVSDQDGTFRSHHSGERGGHIPLPQASNSSSMGGQRSPRTLPPPDNIFLSIVSPQKKFPGNTKCHHRFGEPRSHTHTLLGGLHHDTAALETHLTVSSKIKQKILVPSLSYTLWHLKGRNGDLCSHKNMETVGGGV